MVFSAPQGIYCFALVLAIYEDNQNNRFYIECKHTLGFLSFKIFAT